LAILAQPNPGAAAFSVDELDPSIFKRPPQGGQDGPPRLRSPSLELADRHCTDFGLPRQIVLGPIEQGSGSAALGWCHGASISRCWFSSNMAEFAVPRFNDWWFARKALLGTAPHD
jgi:hypothetical protein